MNLKASVIILVWNGAAYVTDCLNAVLSQDYADLEIIVVDNGSTDGSADMVAEQFPQVQLIRNERNLGFSAGNNVGLRAATGDVMVLLNQDTVVQPGWLSALANALSAEPDIGIAGGKALYPNGDIQHAGGHVNERGEGKHYGYRQGDAEQFNHIRDVDYVTGASLAITRQTFETIGGLDEGFTPAYFEDVDWCYRARKAGFRVGYVPQAVFIHKEASTSADKSYEGMYLPNRNRLRFVLKHWPLNRLLDEFMPAERASLEKLAVGGERWISTMHHAYLYHLLHLADIVAWRQKLLDTLPDEADALANLLVTLRTIVPLNPPRVGAAAEAVPEESITGTPREDTLKELDQRAVIQETEFHSTVPIIGPLIAAFRRRWNSVATKWYVLPMIHQQARFNALMITALREAMAYQEGRMNRQEQDRQRLGQVLAE